MSNFASVFVSHFRLFFLFFAKVGLDNPPHPHPHPLAAYAREPFFQTCFLCLQVWLKSLSLPRVNGE